MVFNSLSYFIFLPLIFLCFITFKDRYRWLVLLLASYVFYGFLLKPVLLIALSVVILLTFQIGLLINESKNVAAQRLFLWVGVGANIALLIYFKYLLFIVQNTNQLFSVLGMSVIFEKPVPLVSIGLSFYIFQAISYLFDVYLEIEKPERHFGHFALYLSFFPKLLQGPIERAGDLLPQLKNKFEFNYDNMRFGILMFLWGLFKKVVLADRLGLYVDSVYGNVMDFTGLPLLLATYTYALQIYMDFSGYTDMALGSARIFNINLTQNFNRPYFATSIADFWRRWHISFSRWILDYIFKPLQMKWRNWRNWGTAVALVVAFLISGIWHGASWGFVIWGGLHGLYMACSVFYKPYQKKLHKLLGIEKTFFLKGWQILVTFNLVSFAWVFFRAGSITDAIYIISHMFSGTEGVYSKFLLSQARLQLVIVSITLFIYLAVNIGMRSKKIVAHYNSSPYLRWGGYYLLLLWILFFYQEANSDFIYFKF